MAQSVEHVLGKDEVTSSSLVSSSKKSTLLWGCFFFYSSLPRTLVRYTGSPKYQKIFWGKGAL